MVSIESFRELALSFPETTELPHFEKTSFHVNKKIFATLEETQCKTCLKFSQRDQAAFTSLEDTVIYPVPNKWGQQGWTFIELNTVAIEVLLDALTTAYCEAAPKRLSDQFLRIVTDTPSTHIS